MNVKRTPEKEIAFLAALAATGNVTRAAEAAGIGRSAIYEWRREDPDFEARWLEAQAIGDELLEDEARRRAMDGVDEPVFYQGQATGTVRRYSDTLLIFLLKGSKPDKYRDNAKVELAGNLNVNTMTDEEIAEELAALAAAGVVAALPSPDTDDGSDLL